MCVCMYVCIYVCMYVCQRRRQEKTTETTAEGGDDRGDSSRRKRQREMEGRQKPSQLFPSHLSLRTGACAGPSKPPTADLAEHDSDELHRDPPKMVLSQHFEQVVLQQLEGEAQVVSENERVQHTDDVVSVVGVVLVVQPVQDLHLHLCLVEVSGRVLYHFHGNHLTRVALPATYDLTERAATEHRFYDVSHTVRGIRDDAVDAEDEIRFAVVEPVVHDRFRG